MSTPQPTETPGQTVVLHVAPPAAAAPPRLPPLASMAGSNAGVAANVKALYDYLKAREQAGSQ